MTPAILAWLQSAHDRFVPFPGKTLEIGSYDVNGSPRSVFGNATSYFGIDQSPGPGVDLVANIHFFDNAECFDLIICCEMLEHDTNPLGTVAWMKHHLAPGGLLIATTPANSFPYHAYPRDYWRFMPDFYTDIASDGMSLLELVEIEGPTLCFIGHLAPCSL